MVAYSILTERTRPYLTLPERDNLKRIVNDPTYRPTFDGVCKWAVPEGIKGIVRDCWRFDPAVRPSFAQVLERLESAREE